jgi:prepilin-type N-terminal cleavage/methylation domain-containing protein
MSVANVAARTRRGFTLIELLVVIAIIAILAAILFPVFAQARAKARQASCTSNVKQLSLSFMMYVQDYDENYPFWSWGPSSDVGGCSGPSCGHFESVWFNAIYPYVKNAGVYKCPSTNDNSTIMQNNMWAWTTIPFATTTPNNGIVQPLWNATISYGMSEPLEQGYAFGNGISPTTLAAVPKPAETLMIADCNNGLTAEAPPTSATDPVGQQLIGRVAYPNAPANCWSVTATCGAAQDNPASQPGFPAVFDSQARHSGGDLIGFADGHAKWLRDTNITKTLFNGGF